MITLEQILYFSESKFSTIPIPIVPPCLHDVIKVPGWRSQESLAIMYNHREQNHIILYFCVMYAADYNNRLV